MNKVTFYLYALVTYATSFLLGTRALAVSGVGGMAAQVTSQFGAIAKLITAGSYVAGMAFIVGAIVKFKAHKDAPTQIPIGTPIALLFIGAALLFIPSLFKAMGVSLFGTTSLFVANVSGITEFGVGKPQ